MSKKRKNILGNSKISEILNINNKRNELLKRGKKLLEKKKDTEDEFEKISIQETLNSIASEIKKIDFKKENIVVSELADMHLILDGDVNDYFKEITNFLTNEYDTHFSNWETVSFLVLFFYKNILIEYKVSDFKNNNFNDFIEKLNFNSKYQEHQNNNNSEEVITKKINQISRQNLKILYLLLDKMFLDESKEKLEGIKNIKPYNEKQSIVYKLNEDLNKQVNDHFVNLKVKKKFKTI